MLGFTMLIGSWGTTYFPVGGFTMLLLIEELNQSAKYNIYYVPLDPVPDYVFIADLNTRLRVC